MRRLLLAAALALAGAAAGAAPAAAHANYVRSTPAADARLVKPPAEVKVAFSEPPEPRESELQVIDTNGARVDVGGTAASGEPNGLRVALKPIGDGGYTVIWKTVSAVDGHETGGTFAFAVGNAPLPALPDVASSPPPSPIEIAGRALSYAGTALALGVVFFALRVHVPADAEEERRERQLLLGGAGLLAAGSLALVAGQGLGIPPRLALFLGLRGLTGILIAAAVLAPFKAATKRDIVLANALTAALTATLVSHAAAVGDSKDMLLDLAHVLAVSVWSGGVVAMLWIVLRRRREAAELAKTVWRFSLVSLVAVALLVTTGVLQSLDRLVLLEDLWETPYGIALGAKILLLAATLAFGALNLLRYGPAGRRRQLVRGTIAETGLLAAVFVAASVLTASAPPAQATGAAFDETRHVSGFRVELLVPVAAPGRNRFVLRVHQGLTPVAGAEKVALRFTMVEHDMGETELVADERAPGEYVATGSPVAMQGTWKVRTIVRIPGHEDVDADFTLPVGNAGAATAQALTAGPYSLVVFPDPSSPSEGAPLSLSIVVFDSKTGQAATGRAVTGTLKGNAGQAASPSAFTASEAGNGRYRIDVAALAKGSWTMRIAVDGPANAVDYTFDVTP